MSQGWAREMGEVGCCLPREEPGHSSVMDIKGSEKRCKVKAWVPPALSPLSPASHRHSSLALAVPGEEPLSPLAQCHMCLLGHTILFLDP